MRVSFETCTLVYKGKSEEDLPIFERENVKRVEGDVVDTVVLPTPSFFGDRNDEPCFVVALDDLSFTHVPIKECTRIFRR